MSSMLFKPIIRVPLISTDEYRDDTLMIGSPMVFHTAPPHPASKARITWSPVLVGGADASQNGFGDLIPAKLTLKSATIHLEADCQQLTANSLRHCHPRSLLEARRAFAWSLRRDSLEPTQP